MKKRYLLITIFLLLILGINVTNAEEVYEFERKTYSADEFAEIFEAGCGGPEGYLCSGTCSNGAESDRIRYYNNPCGNVDEISKFKIGDGSEAITKDALGYELFYKYFLDKVIHYFEKIHFESEEQFLTFFSAACAPESNTNCTAVCADGGTQFVSVPANACGSIYNVEQFKFDDSDLNSTYRILQRIYFNGDTNYFNYLLNESTYCNGYNDLSENNSRYLFCDNAINNLNEITDKCNYIFKFNDKSLAINSELTTDKKDLVLTISDFTAYGGSLSEDEGVMRLTTPSTELYFYPKYDDFNKFKNEYIKRYNEIGSCPTLCFGYDRNKGTMNGDVWYTALDETEFDSKKYRSGYRQCSFGGQTTLEKERQKANREPITFENCAELFADSPQLLDMIKFMVNIVKIGIPILLIGLGISDFSRAIFVGKEDEMKKAQEKFIKRIIIGVCVFLVPTILKLILTLGNSVWGDVISTDFCGIL